MVTSFLLQKEVNKNWIRTTLANHTKKKKMSHPEIGEHAVGTDIANYGVSNSAKDVTIPHNPYPNTISIHIHHWQIFYTLAFFTR